MNSDRKPEHSLLPLPDFEQVPWDKLPRAIPLLESGKSGDPVVVVPVRDSDGWVETTWDSLPSFAVLIITILMAARKLGLFN